MVTTIDSLTRFPVKGLSAQTMSSVKLSAGLGFPGDRRFGFARPDSGFDPNKPKPLPKTKFYMLARDAKLALLETEFDDDTGMLSMSSADSSARFDIRHSEGKQEASLFLKSYLSLPDEETPILYEASPHRFTDVSVVSLEMMNAISIINLDSVNEFSKSIGQFLDPARFRGNFQVSGLPAFAELDMVGHHLAIGEVRLEVLQRTSRCPATEVDPDTAERNVKTPKLLLKNYGHMDMGVYAQVVTGGVISKGDVVELI